MKRIKISQKQIAILCVCVFAISLIPMIIIAFYNHPAFDDFIYSGGVKQELNNGNGVFAVFSAIIKVIKNTYYSWQGTYSAIFLFTLQPAIFGEQFYVLSTFILLVPLIFSTAYFMKVLCCDCLKINKYNTAIVTCVSLFLSIQLVPSPLQAFFWYNGSVFYTFFFSLMLIFFTVLIRLLFLNQGTKKRTLGWIFLVLFGIFIAGGNYITALLTAVILFGICAWAWFFSKRFSDWRLDKKIWLTVVFAVFMICFIVNMAAPGNAIRQENFTNRVGAVMSIVQAFGFAFKSIQNWSQNILLLFALLFVTPILYYEASKLNFSFRLPALAPIVSVILLAVQHTPTSYAQNHPGDLRCQNIIFYSYIMLLMGTIFYICGWISHRLVPKLDLNEMTANFAKIKIWYLMFLAIFAVVFALGLDNEPLKATTSYSAYYSLRSGEAKDYHRQIEERLEVLNDPTVKEVEFEPIKSRPKCLFVYWADVDSGGLNEYYNKESVTLKQ